MEHLPPELSKYDIHKDMPIVRDFRLQLLSQMAVHEARRNGRAELEYDDLIIEVEIDDGEMLH